MPWTKIAVYCVLIPGSTLLLYYLLTRGIVSRLIAGQAPRSGFGVVAVDGAPQGLGSQLRADGVDVVFVHGLASNPDTTWRARPPQTHQTNLKAVDTGKQDVCWVTDLLLDDIPPAVLRKTRIFFYNHDSYWKRDAVQTRLWNLAGNMLQHVREKVRRTQEERARKLIFVGYSYGGLLIKQALVRAKGDPNFEDIATHTKAILFLGTPHRGSSFTQLGAVAAWLLGPLGSNRSILDELVYDSLNLQDLQEQYMVTMGDGLRVYNFFEERRTPLINVGFMHWSKFCVEEQSAKYFDTSHRVQNVGLAVDHSGLNKFASRTAEYGIIRDKLLGLLPPIPQDVYSVPLNRVGHYASRNELSRRINEVLRPSDNGDDNCDTEEYQALVIHGMGGVGKTQLALNFIQNNQKHYNLIFWIDAHTPEKVRRSFERGSAALGLMSSTASKPDSQLKDSDAVAGVLRWFSERDEGDQKWLVVVDNADDTSWNVEEIIPFGPQGHVIVTSQHPQSSRFLGGLCTRVHVGSMTRDEARALLRKHIGAESEQTSTDINDLCDQVANRLGCLALATDLAGAYLTEQLELHHPQTSAIERQEAVKAVLTKYLLDYGQHQDELLQWGPFYQLSSYEKTVWTVWDTSLAAIDKSSPRSNAGRVLTFLAQFGEGYVQEELFRLSSVGWPVMMTLLQPPEDDRPEWMRQMVMSMGQVWDDFQYRQAIWPLIRYGLLQRVGGDWDATTMHGLVRWRARKAHQENNEAWARWTGLFMMAVVCQTNREKGRPEFRRHVITHLMGMGESDFDPGRELQLQGNSLTTSWAELAELYHDNGRWPEAERLGVQVMEARIRVLGEKHPDTLTSVERLASTYRAQGLWPKAEELQLRVMEARKRVLGEEHPDTLNSMANLSLTYGDQGRWQRVEELQMRVMEARITVLGKEHPDTLTSMANLVWTYYKQGRLVKAEELGLRVKEERTRVLTDEHLDTHISMAHLGAIYEQQGRSTEAEEWKKKVLETRMRKLGREHPNTLISMVNLALTYRHLGKLKEAEDLEVEVLEIRKRVFGSDHPSTLISMNNLAWTRWNQGRREEAISLMRGCISTSIGKLGRDNPSTIERLYYWGQRIGRADP